MTPSRTLRLPDACRTYVKTYEPTHLQDADTQPAKIPILFIHGFLLTSREWHGILPAFPEYTKILYDVYAHGSTDTTPEDVSVEFLAQQANEVLSHLNHQSAIVVAHSTGAIIALQLARDFPDRVKSLILLTPSELPMPPVMMDRVDIIRTAGTQAIVDTYLSWIGVSKREDTEVRLEIQEEVELHDGRWEALARFYAAIARFEYKNARPVETWVVRGIEDVLVPEKGTEMVQKLTGAQGITLEQGHFMTYEGPQAVAETLRRILVP